ncbi:MAG: hypothetical protein IIU65_05575 [Clostridia bacterium]|nr:hypothetical protein [Clostridia bacterium]
MKIAGKIIYAVWALVITAVLVFYSFSCYMGYRVEQIAKSAIETQGEDFTKFEKNIDEHNYLKLWHAKPDNASYDKVSIQELSLTQKYTITRPYIMPFKDTNAFFSFNKIGYIYNIKMYDANGNEVKSVAPANSKIVLDISYDNATFKIDNVFYDNDSNTYKVSKLNTWPLIIILIINAIARNIRYFDYCVIRRRKRNILRFIQPYIFPILIIISIFLNNFQNVLILGILEETVFTIIYFIKKIIDKTVQKELSKNKNAV